MIELLLAIGGIVVVLQLIGDAHPVLQVLATLAVLYIVQSIRMWREQRRRDYQYWHGE